MSQDYSQRAKSVGGISQTTANGYRRAWCHEPQVFKSCLSCANLGVNCSVQSHCLKLAEIFGAVIESLLLAGIVMFVLVTLCKAVWWE